MLWESFFGYYKIVTDGRPMLDRALLRLLWAEEFDHPHGLNPQVWNYDLGDGSAHGIPGWGNNEREYYIESAVTTENGLTISAKRIPPTSGLDAYYGPAEWTSGKIHTAKKLGFKYGYLEFKARAPKGGGSWPAIWMLGSLITELTWPTCGEIDIFEGSGNVPKTVRGTLHGPGYSGEHGVTHAIDYENNLGNDFHTYGILWNEDGFEWFFDGEPYFALTRNHPQFEGKHWPFDEEFYLIINLAIGGWFAGEVSPDLKEAQFDVKNIYYFSYDGKGELLRH